MIIPLWYQVCSAIVAYVLLREILQEELDEELWWDISEEEEKEEEEEKPPSNSIYASLPILLTPGLRLLVHEHIRFWNPEKVESWFNHMEDCFEVGVFVNERWYTRKINRIELSNSSEVLRQMVESIADELRSELV